MTILATIRSRILILGITRSQESTISSKISRDTELLLNQTIHLDKIPVRDNLPLIITNQAEVILMTMVLDQAILQAEVSIVAHRVHPVRAQVLQDHLVVLDDNI